MDLDRPTDGAGAHRVFVVVEAHQAVFRHRGRQRVEAVEPAAIRDELRPLLLEHVPDGLLRPFRMGMLLGVRDAFVGQPGVQLIIGFDPQARGEKTLPDETDLVLDRRLRRGRFWPFSHPDAGVQATGSTRWWAHIWRKRRLYCRSLPTKTVSTAVFMLS
jgi:hypothetical protein